MSKKCVDKRCAVFHCRRKYRREISGSDEWGPLLCTKLHQTI